MTLLSDAEALAQVQDFLSTDPDGTPPYEAIARVMILATASVATMQLNVELEKQLDRLREALIQKELR